jgi:hypothetical protein
MYQSKGWWVVVAAFAFCVATVGCGTGIPILDPNVVVIEHTDYNPPPPKDDDGLVDDKLEDKKTEFTPELVDRRRLGEWLINQSEAVIRLDVPLARPDSDGELLVLRATYADSLKAAKEHRSWMPVLPSVNLLDGKAKQFDDGLYAAIDQAYFLGRADDLPSHISLVERLLAKVEPDSPAAAYLAAGLTLGGQEAKLTDNTQRDKLIKDFQANPALSKPIGFYTWNDNLKKCWAFMRFFQKPLEETDPIAQEIVKSLEGDSGLAADCQTAAQFYGKLTNPLSRLTFADAIGTDLSSPEALEALRKSKGVSGPGLSLFPPSGSRETELFQRLFPLGVPEGANLMKELVTRIRSGEIDLSPRASSGWYDQQVYALETLLLPERGEEHNKLLLTKPYKKRMLEAFQALITKRRETHFRQLEMAAASEAPPPPEEIRPRLRVEPCPSYYLRTARSYAFLLAFLNEAIPHSTFKTLHGLRPSGERGHDLLTDLEFQRDLFYGLYLLSCEDIGHAPTLKESEVADPELCYTAAEHWLGKIESEPDLAEDTRVAVPIYVDPIRSKTRLWVTLGVRLAQLDTRFATAPRIKPASGEGDWQPVEDWKLADAPFLISVDEFAEVEVPTLSPPNREELRKLCDQHKSKEKILEALMAGSW